VPKPSIRRPPTALASFDVGLLRAWYMSMTKLNSKLISPQSQHMFTLFLLSARPPQLIVILHDFEQLNPNVMQDVFYICRSVKMIVYHVGRLIWYLIARVYLDFLSSSSPTLQLLRRCHIYMRPILALQSHLCVFVFTLRRLGWNL
jgi:hypothetical protein